MILSVHLLWGFVVALGWASHHPTYVGRVQAKGWYLACDHRAVESVSCCQSLFLGLFLWDQSLSLPSSPRILGRGQRQRILGGRSAESRPGLLLAFSLDTLF